MKNLLKLEMTKDINKLLLECACSIPLVYPIQDHPIREEQEMEFQYDN